MINTIEEFEDGKNYVGYGFDSFSKETGKTNQTQMDIIRVAYTFLYARQVNLFICAESEVSNPHFLVPEMANSTM